MNNEVTKYIYINNMKQQSLKHNNYHKSSLQKI